MIASLHKRGDLSPCGTLRFWQYQKYVSKKTGQRCERWVPVDQYERLKQQSNSARELFAARREWRTLSRNKVVRDQDAPRHRLVLQRGGGVYGVTETKDSYLTVKLTNQREMSSWVFGKKDITLKQIHIIAPHLPK